MVTSEEFRHVPTGALAILAQRLGRVFASPSTWYRLVSQHGWRRPRARVHPAKPREGIRASAPNEIWHIDATVIRLIDGTKAYVHAVIDNYSRKILAWKVASRLEPGSTVAVLRDAANQIVGSEVSTTLLADGGRENFNSAVDDLVEAEALQRVLAMTDITFSNSMIESWWRALKHQWLYLNTLDSTGAVDKLVGFYVAEHNTRIPHSAFSGATPDEMYFGDGAKVAEELRHARSSALKERLKTNRRESCAACA